MSEVQPSKAELIKAHVRDSIANKSKSELDVDGRKRDFAELHEKNPTFTFTQQQYLDLFKKELKKQGKNVIDYGLGGRVVKKTSGKSSSVRGKTQTVRKDVIKKGTELENKDGATKEGETKDGKFIPRTEGGKGATQEETKDEIDKIRMKFTEKNVGATIKAMFGGMRFLYPALEPLSDDEKEDLADLWLPFFEKYLQSDYGIVLIPLFASAAILSPKLKKAKAEKDKNKKNSIKELKKEKQKLEEKLARAENEKKEKDRE